MQFLNWHGLVNQKKTARTSTEVNVLFHIHTLYYVGFRNIFRHWSAILNITKCSLMLRCHHSDSSSEGYQEVKTSKIFYILCGTYFRVTGQIHAWQLDYRPLRRKLSCFEMFFSMNLLFTYLYSNHKSGLRGFRPGLTQTVLYSHRSCNVGFKRREIVLSV